MKIISRQFTKADKYIESGIEYQVPPYKVGSNQLLFFFDGVLCIPGEDNQYDEIGEKGSISTKIKLYFDIKPGDEINFIVIPALVSEANND